MSPQLHRWNRDFSWCDLEGPFEVVTPVQARAYDERGCFVFEDAFDAAALRRVIAEIDPIEEEVTRFLRTREDGRLFIADAAAITFSTHLVTRSRLLREFVGGPVFRGLARDLIGCDVRLYWDQAVYKKPEKPQPFPWHQDNGYTYLEPQQYLTCWVALSDTDVENGCPWIVPGLHRLGTLEHWLTDTGWQCLEEPADAEPVAARAGSIVVFSSLTPHSTGPNLTRDVRKAYIVQFAPDGASTLHEEAGLEAPVRRLQDDPERQFPILGAGCPVV